jgi:hypothetical protein
MLGSQFEVTYARDDEQLGSIPSLTGSVHDCSASARGTKVSCSPQIRICATPNDNMVLARHESGPTSQQRMSAYQARRSGQDLGRGR